MPRLLCTPPLPTVAASELAALGYEVTTLNFDGTIEGGDDDEEGKWDVGFITPAAFGSCKGGFVGLQALYDRLAALVRGGRVGYVHLCASGIDVKIFWSVIRACAATGTAFSRSTGVYAKPMAQYVMAHTLGFLRKVPEHAEQQARKVYKAIVSQVDARGRIVGVVGAGAIGEEVAHLAQAFGMETMGYRRSAPPETRFDALVVDKAGLDDLLRRSDVVVVAVPLTAATKHLIGQRELALMKPTALLINVARGAVVDQAALVQALLRSSTDASGPAHAILDVFEAEPLPAEDPLWDLPNVTLTAHDSWLTSRALEDNHAFFLDNLRRHAANEPVLGLLDPDSDLCLPAILSAPPKTQ